GKAEGKEEPENLKDIVEKISTELDFTPQKLIVISALLYNTIQIESILIDRSQTIQIGLQSSFKKQTEDPSTAPNENDRQKKTHKVRCTADPLVSLIPFFFSCYISQRCFVRDIGSYPSLKDRKLNPHKYIFRDE